MAAAIRFFVAIIIFVFPVPELRHDGFHVRAYLLRGPCLRRHMLHAKSMSCSALSYLNSPPE